MANYQQPGVTVRELVSPTFAAPVSGAETVVAIVAPSRGYENVTDVVTLIDDTAVELSRANPQTSTIVVTNAADPNAAAFVETNASNGQRDYTLTTSGDVVSIKRTMQTSIANGEEVVTYFENAASPTKTDAFTHLVTLNKITPVSIGSDAAAATEAGSIVVMSEGAAPTDDYTIANEGAAAPTIVWESDAAVIQEFQKLYLSYDISGTAYVDQPVQLNGTTTVALTAYADNIVVNTAPGLGAGATDAFLYTITSSGTDEDYVVSGSGASTKIARAAGTTSIGAATDALQVKITYQATPSAYWEPTRLTSSADVERKYGPAFDTDGTINSPLTFAAGLAFMNGASEIICQPLFGNTVSSPVAPTANSSSEWELALTKLRTRTDVNVIVPIVSSSDLPTGDTLVSSILNTVANHISYMANLGEGIAAICGGDSTVSGQSSEATLRSQAEALNNERMALISPGAFYFVNFQNTLMQIGGQYAAACAAGAMARYGVGATLTRKPLAGLSGVVELKDDGTKNDDAASGLMVVHTNRSGNVEVRHGRTTNVTSAATSELNVVRSKLYMMESLRVAVDTQVIGKIIADGRAPLAVSSIVSNVLENLVQRNIITTYFGMTARLSESNPTQVEVRFAYRPAFTLNNVTIEFNIDLTNGTVTGA